MKCKTCGTDLHGTPPATHLLRKAKPEYRHSVCWVCARLAASVLIEIGQMRAAAAAAGMATDE